jgi:hypothetical protein
MSVLGETKARRARKRAIALDDARGIALNERSMESSDD